MGKFKSIVWTVIGVIMSELIIVAMMQFQINSVETAATTIELSPNAATYAATIAALRYWPLTALFIVPAIGAVVIVFILRQSEA